MQAKTKELIIQWFSKLFTDFQVELIDKQTDVFEQLINSIYLKEQDLVSKVLSLLCMLSQKNEKYLRKIIRKLIERFQNNVSDIKQDKINQVISVLCSSIQSERVFLEFARILHETTAVYQEQTDTLTFSTDIRFAQDLIETLTITVASNPMYEGFRNKLKGKKPTEFVGSKEELFFTLYRTWCLSPVATLTLCLLARNYELAYNLIPRFTMVRLDTTRLIQLGNLVQLIESPSFTSKVLLVADQR